MEHGPDSLHVLAPVDTDVTSHDMGVRDPFFTVVFLIVNPGRAANCKATAETWPVAVRVVIANV